MLFSHPARAGGATERTDQLFYRLLLKLLFAVCVAWFVYHGPYRALRYSTTGDFATVYAAARCWLHGANPYHPASLKEQLAAAGAPPDILRDQDLNPSVYSPAALLWIAPFATLDWAVANPVWCLLSMALFGIALLQLLLLVPMQSEAKWIAASLALLFSPTYVGIYDGNPGVAIISLIVLSICSALGGSALLSGLLFGLALCFKPQLACCALLLFLLWKKWHALVVGTAVVTVSLLVGWLVVAHGAGSADWWRDEQRNIASSYQPGGTSDPTPTSPYAWQLLNAQTLASYALREPRAYNAVVWCLGVLLLALFWHVWRRRRTLSPWQEMAFFAALTLALSYHRYYDGQLLLLSLPLLAQFWKMRRLAPLFAIACCLLVLAFPIQSYFAHVMGSQAMTPAAKQIVLLRNQAAATLLLTLLFAVSLVRRAAETGT